MAPTKKRKACSSPAIQPTKAASESAAPTSAKEQTPEPRDRGICYIARLPEDVLMIIFAKLANFGGSFASLYLSHVCSQWRMLALHTPNLWQDTELIGECPCKECRSAAEARNYPLPPLLSLSAERSRNSLTHFKTRYLTSSRAPESCFTLFERSETSLRDTDFDADILWHTGRFAEMVNCAPTDSPAPMETTDAAKTRLVQLGLGAPSLERLRVRFSTSLTAGMQPELFASLPLATPQELVVRRKEAHQVRTWDIGVPDIVVSQNHAWLAILDRLTPRVTKLTFLQTGFCGDTIAAIWMKWAWDTMKRRGAELRSCHIRADAQCLAADPEVILPKLRQLCLYGGPYEYPANLRYGQTFEAHERHYFEGLHADFIGPPKAEWDGALARQVWFETPALTTISASLTVAAKVHAPSIQCAFVRLWDEKEFELLPQLLASWPQLNTLTVEIMPERIRIDAEHPKWWHALDWTTQALREVFSVLTPSKSGAVHAPKLRHLGLTWCDNPADSCAHRPAWATDQWVDCDDVVCAITMQRAHGCPWLTDGVLDLVRQRKALADGPDAASPATPPRSPTSGSEPKSGPANEGENQKEDEPEREGEGEGQGEGESEGSDWYHAPLPARPRSFQDSRASPSGFDTLREQPCAALQTLKVGGMCIRPEIWKELQEVPQLHATCGTERAGQADKRLHWLIEAEAREVHSRYPLC